MLDFHFGDTWSRIVTIKNTRYMIRIREFKDEFEKNHNILSFIDEVQFYLDPSQEFILNSVVVALAKNNPNKIPVYRLYYNAILEIFDKLLENKVYQNILLKYFDLKPIE